MKVTIFSGPHNHFNVLVLDIRVLDVLLIKIVHDKLGTVWGAVMVSVVLWGLTLWWIVRMWSQMTGGPALRADTALLYGWGALMEVHPKVPTSATSGQVKFCFGVARPCCFSIMRKV